MRKLNKNYRKSLKSVKAQKACPCSYSACGSCGTSVAKSTAMIDFYYNQHKSGQDKLY